MNEDSLYEFDQAFYQGGATYLCGVDEAGRGPLAGPVAVAAVLFTRDVYIEGVGDSKALSEKKRETLYPRILEKATAVSVSMADAREIEQYNILAATHRAALRAIAEISPPPDKIITDYLKLKNAGAPLEFFTKGDARSHAIAAASIVAKVTRDRLMMQYHEKYPVYNFAGNKGYGTRQHRDALKQHGPCPIHRRSFRGVLPEGFL